MVDYVKTTNFLAKDSLVSGDPNKRIRGAEFNVEFDNLAVAVASKVEKNNGVHTGTTSFQNVTMSGTLSVSGVSTLDSLNVTNNAVITGALSAGASTLITTGNRIAVFGASSIFSANPASTGTLDNVAIGDTTPSTGAFTTLSASGTSTFAATSATNLSYTGTLTGGTGVINIGSGQIYKGASGDVGIGTSTPRSAKLNTKGATLDSAVASKVRHYIAEQTVGVGTPDNAFTVETESLGGGALAYRIAIGDLFTNDGLTNSFRLESRFVDGQAAALTESRILYPNFLSFYQSGTERLRIDSAGNLGVGTSVPLSRLHVGSKSVGSTAAYAVFDGTSTAKFRIDDVANTAQNRRLITNNFSRPSAFVADDLTFGVTAVSFGDGVLTFETAAAGANQPIERLRIDSVGNVGIGTSSPTNLLSLEKSQNNATTVSITNSTSGTSAAATFSARSNVASLNLQANSTAFLNTAGLGRVDGCSIFTNSAATGGITIAARNASGIITMHTGGETERARITSGGNQIDYQPTPAAQNTTATLSVAQLQTRIITSNAAVTLTLPTGTALEGYTTSMAIDTAFEVTFIATAASAITVAGNTGVTTVGNLTVAANSSGTFRIRKTATNTFVAYRL